MLGLTPAELNMMQADVTDLLNGPDAVPITMNWLTGGTMDPVYNTLVGGTQQTQIVNGIIVFAAARNAERGLVKGSVEKRKFAEVPEADAALVIPASVTIQGLNSLTFVIAGLGTYHAIEKPAEELQEYAVMYPSGQAMVQWVYVKAQK